MKIAGYEVERVAAGHYRIESPEGPLVITYFSLSRRWGIEGPHKAEYSDGFRTLTEAVRFAYRHLIKSMSTKFDKCEHCCERGATVSDRGMRNVNVILMCDTCWGIQEDALGDWVTDPSIHANQMRSIEDARHCGESDRRSGELSMRDMYVAPVDTPRPTRFESFEWVHVEADGIMRVDAYLDHYGYRNAQDAAVDWAESVRRASDNHATYADELTRMAREDGLL